MGPPDSAAMLLCLATATAALTTPTLKLPGTGDAMPAIGYGTWLSKKGEVYEGTKAALATGYKHIDEAWVYMNEAEVGKAISESLADGTLASREELFLTSKLWNNFHRPELVRQGVLESIQALGVEYLDMYLCHFPVAFTPGTVEASSADQVDDVPLGATWTAMEKLVDEGLVKNIGVSNFEIEDLKVVQAVATKPIACNQFETHPYYQRQPLLDYCTEHGIVVTAHSSMGGAANAMSAFHASPPLAQDATIRQIASKHDTTAQAVLLAWALTRPTAIIPKSITPARIAANLEAVLALTLDADDLAAIAMLDKPGLEGCYCHPKTPWLGRSEFTGKTDHYYG
jgi:diketogulonate reductase-like aldo/keto reductase